MKCWKKVCLLLHLLALPLAIALAQSPARDADEGEQVQKQRSKLAKSYMEALALVKENYAGQVDYDKTVKASILSMLHTLDPHSSFLDRDEWAKYKSEQSSRYSGIGSVIGERNNKVYIISPMPEAPAYRAGLRYGDQIIEVDGDSTDGLSSQQVSSKLIGTAGTDVTIKVARLGVNKPIERTITRNAVPLLSIPSYFLLGKGIGYINLQRSFNTTTHDEMLSAIARLSERKMSRLILDLRGNRGGLVEQAWKVAGIFLHRGQNIVSISGRPPKRQARNLLSYNYTPDEYPVIVLTDRLTASSAEIVTGALQDHDRALIVGRRSFGKGLVQNLFELSNGSALTLTTGKYRTPSGRAIQRDYSNLSLYDYYRHSGETGAPAKPEWQTDAGRPVYGGGGIAPDVEVALSQRAVDLERLWLEPVFEFARQAAAGHIPELAHLQVNHSADHAHRLEADEYLVNDATLEIFKKFLKQHKGLRADWTRVSVDGDFIKRQIRFEIVTAAYGQDVASQILLEGDALVQRAINEFPRAEAMAEAFRRRWKDLLSTPTK
jgi:carboxyl-terminal processing protease